MDKNRQAQADRKTNKQTKQDKTKRELTELNPYHKQSRQIDRKTYDPTKISLIRAWTDKDTVGQKDRHTEKAIS